MGILKPKEKIEEDKKEENDIEKIDDNEQEEVVNYTTVFVKNLSFHTTENSLNNAMQSLNGLKSVKIKTKQDSNNKDKKLSMGYGFLEFKTEKDAKIAIKTMQVFIFFILFYRDLC